MKANRKVKTDKQHFENPQKKPTGKSHILLMQKQVRELEQKISELRLQNQDRKKRVRTVEIPVQKTIEREITEEVEKEVIKQVWVDQEEIVEKVVERRVQIPRLVITQKIIVRPQTPPEEILKEVVQEKEVIREIMDQFDQQLYSSVQDVEKQRAFLLMEYERSKKQVEELEKELRLLRQAVI